MPSQVMRILVATKPVDFRKGHDGLAALAQSMLAEDPFTGTVFVFRAKRADRLKILFWDGSGLVMAYKRLEADSFTWPAIRDGAMTLSRTQFEALFAGLDWRRVRPLETPKPLHQLTRRSTLSSSAHLSRACQFHTPSWMRLLATCAPHLLRPSIVSSWSPLQRTFTGTLAHRALSSH